ncbi:UV-stimulated scaffold protein A [Galemys pyrenaicus]|uniref:UV-stimulated scaffold protein A n=1 Tax=Galemys pyrenaicus TaxID=202257 RepID=A0A8J6DHR1_GALPY|nr:UV-stimulated scaffold protein A [Galemys pyrenaicus]
MDQKLSGLVEVLTTSGEPQLDPQKMKELKKICKSSEEQLSRAYHLLRAQLGREHAQVRLSAFQVLEQLFTRSHRFRVLVVSSFQEILELTLGTEHTRPLPPPREAAQRLRQAALQAVRGWAQKYGAAYKKLALGYHFLQHSKQVDFQDTSARTPVGRRREEERQKRLDRIYRTRAEQAAREMEDASEDIQRCLTELDSCFSLLVPFDLAPSPGACPTVAPGTLEGGPPDPRGEEQPCCSKTLPACAPPGEAEDEEWQEEDEEQREHGEQGGFVRHHGLGSRKYTLCLELSADSLRVREDEDNTAVLHSARDSLKLIRDKFLPAARTWVQLFTRAGVQGNSLEGAVRLKAELERALGRAKELAIEPRGARSPQPLTSGAASLMAGPLLRDELGYAASRPGRPAAPGDEDEDEDDFVEVPEKEGYEACVPELRRPESGLEQDPAPQGMGVRTDGEAWDPTSAAAQPCPPPRTPGGQEDSRQPAAERARAPVVPFGLDLCYWGQEPPAAETLKLRLGPDWALGLCSRDLWTSPAPPPLAGPGQAGRPQRWAGSCRRRSESQHRFWKPSEVDTEVDSGRASRTRWSRCIPFPGKFELVQHRCGALRPDGRLCGRQDRLKCPFHGRIIPRDAAGRPLRAEDRAQEQRQQLQRPTGRPDWEDPELMRDVEAATGVDLGSSRCGRGRGRRRRHPGLVDLKRQNDTARARIARKVFAKAAVRRAVRALSQADRRRQEKFANQFNYALS